MIEGKDAKKVSGYCCLLFLEIVVAFLECLPVYDP